MIVQKGHGFASKSDVCQSYIKMVIYCHLPMTKMLRISISRLFSVILEKRLLVTEKVASREVYCVKLSWRY